MPCFSVNFQIAEWRYYNVPQMSGSSRQPVPAADPSGSGDLTTSYRACRDKWVYVFENNGTTITCCRELYVDSHGNIYVNTQDLNPPVDRDQRNDVDSSNPQTNGCYRLPYTVCGYRVTHALFAARTRLPADAIRQLCDRGDSLLPFRDLSRTNDPEVFAFDPETQQHVLRAVDPLTVAYRMNERYRWARDAVTNFTTPNSGQGRMNRRATSDRQKKLLMARVIKSVLDGDPNDDLDLVDDFDGNAAGVRRMEAFITDYERQLERKIRWANALAARLCFFLESDLMTFTKNTYAVEEAEDFHHFIKGWSAATDRLFESGPGKAFLAGVMDDNGHFIHEYVLRTDPAPDFQFQVGRKCASAIVGIWQEVAALYIEKFGKGRFEVAATALVHISREELLVVTTTERSVRVLKRTETQVLAVVEVSIRLNTNVESRLTRWIADGSSSGTFLRNFGQIVEIVNLALSFKALKDADGFFNNAAALLGTIGSVADTLVAFELILNLSRKTAATIGVVGAVMDVIGAGVDMNRMAGRSDYDAMVGYGVAGLGSVVTGIGLAMLATGAGASATIAGAPAGFVLAVAGAVLTAAGWLLAFFAADSDMETFVTHFVWGDSYGDGDGSDIKWVDGPFSAWRNSLDKQLNSMFNLLGAFTLSAHPFTSVDILPGVITPQSKFRVKFHNVYNQDRVHDPEVEIDCGTKRMRHISGSPCITSGNVRFFDNREGRRVIRVTAEVDRSVSPWNHPTWLLQHRSSRCEVKLNINGAGQWVPSSGAWVPQAIYPNAIIGGNQDDNSSKDH